MDGDMELQRVLEESKREYERKEAEKRHLREAGLPEDYVFDD